MHTSDPECSLKSSGHTRGLEGMLMSVVTSYGVSIRRPRVRVPPSLIATYQPRCKTTEGGTGHL